MPPQSKKAFGDWNLKKEIKKIAVLSAVQVEVFVTWKSSHFHRFGVYMNFSASEDEQRETVYQKNVPHELICTQKA